MHLLYRAERLSKTGNVEYLALLVVEGRYYRHSHHKVLCITSELLCVFENKLVASCRERLVLFGVYVLYIHQIPVKVRKQLLYGLVFCAGGRLYRRRETVVLLCASQKRRREIRLCKALAARERKPSAASAVIRHILHDNIHDFLYGDVTADSLYLAVLIHLFYRIILTFRVAAPAAPQHAAFQEHYRAYARSVMGRKLLNVEDPARRIHIIFQNYILRLSCFKNMTFAVL